MIKKKLIEVSLPIEAINAESLRRKQKAPKGWPTSFHKWWAQRPLAAARAVIFAQMVDDPSSWPELFPTQKKQEDERQRLFRIIEELVKWENTNNDDVLNAAREEIWQSWRRSCAENANHPHVKELFTRNTLPSFYDPFAGSGGIPLSAQWLGLETYASDLNPVAVLINKALLEIPSRFANMPAVNPKAQKDKELFAHQWKDAKGLANDVRYYGRWMRDEAEKRIGHLYPKVKVTPEIVDTHPDLECYLNKELTVTAWIWARTVKSPNPAFATVDVPLASTFILSSKQGKETYIEPIIERDGYRFVVKKGKPTDGSRIVNGTSAGKRSGFKCLMSGRPISYQYIRQEGSSGRMGNRLMAIVAEGSRGRVYISPDICHEDLAKEVIPYWYPDTELHGKTRVNVANYGISTFGDLFTSRQLIALSTFSDLVLEARNQILNDAASRGIGSDEKPLMDGGVGALAYAEGVMTYLAFIVDRMVYYGSSLTSWLPKDNALRDCMPRQALAMVWDFAECNFLGKSSGDILTCTNVVSNYLEYAAPNSSAVAVQLDARSAKQGHFIISTDPPYFDNISYADLSDYFYVWLRRSLKSVYPTLFSTLAVPKEDELVATVYRHSTKEEAESFFVDGMTLAMRNLSKSALPSYPVTIYYAFKQTDDEDDAGVVSTGWETFLDAVVQAGFSISGTWPLRTEGAGRMIASGTNALASSIVLVCRPRSADAPAITRRDFISTLNSELPVALKNLQEGNIAPVDLAQASIGPGMAVFTRFSKVLDAEGKPLSVREALALINQILDATLAEQEGDFDADTRFALAWFEQKGFEEGAFGEADVLARAKVTSVEGLADAGILESSRGKVRLLKAGELPENWNPNQDKRLTVWECVHHLIKRLEAGGESAAGELVAQLGVKADTARELAYRLYTICERKKRAQDALSYNALVQSWQEIQRLAQIVKKNTPVQAGLFNE